MMSNKGELASCRNTGTQFEISNPCDELEHIASEIGKDMTDIEFARFMDNKDPIRSLREQFHYPKVKDIIGADVSLVDPEEDCVYFCGNCLGLCPKKAKEYMNFELDKWAKLGVQGFLQEEGVSWTKCDDFLNPDMAKLVGGKPGEVAIMNSLTINLHVLLVSFYRPTAIRNKILCERNAFPSDFYTYESQIRLHGYDPNTSLICVGPREGESTLRIDDILAKIDEEGDSIAVICFGGINYYTGQLFDMRRIAKAGHAKGCYVGFDLAHAVGNVPLYLHDWDIDFACWCSYKYINSSVGGAACIFLHGKHKCNDFPKLKGWWGHNWDTMFLMDNRMLPGAYGYRVSTPAGFLYPPMKASLEIFNQTSMQEIRAKSKLLTAYLQYRINQKYGPTGGTHPGHQGSTEDDTKHIDVAIITPSDPEQRGAQLSLSFSVPTSTIFKELVKRGVVCDERQPFVIRITPAPLYCSFEDIHRFMKYFDEAVTTATQEQR